MPSLSSVILSSPSNGEPDRLRATEEKDGGGGGPNCDMPLDA